MARIALSRGVHKGDIKQMLRDKAGGYVSARTLENTITLARQQLMDAMANGAEQLRASALEVYYSIVRDARASHLSKIKAQDSIVKMLGLAAPLKIQHGGLDGETLDLTKLSIEELDLFEKIIAKAAAEVAGRDDGSEEDQG